jgi:SAGA-associated factor 73
LETIDVTTKNAANPSSSPLVNPLDEKILTAFPTGRPLEDKVDMVQCKHCRRPVHRSVSANHIRDCLNKKQEKLKKKKEAKDAKDAAARREKGEKDDDEGGKRNPAGKNAVVDGDGAKKGKKRKIEGDADKGPNAKKKKKDEPKAKAGKPKGPVDVEKQCGVPLPNGGFCARSLTCKSHSMGLKRSVPGRSLPYDMLLANYQKKNQAKQQRKFESCVVRLYSTKCIFKVPQLTPTLLCPRTSNLREPSTLKKKRRQSWQLLHDTDHDHWQPSHRYLKGPNTSSSA